MCGKRALVSGCHGALLNRDTHCINTICPRRSHESDRGLPGGVRPSPPVCRIGRGHLFLLCFLFFFIILVLGLAWLFVLLLVLALAPVRLVLYLSSRPFQCWGTEQRWHSRRVCSTRQTTVEDEIRTRGGGEEI